MSLSEGQRRLAAIAFTDMVGYTALAEKDELLALRVLENVRADPRFGAHLKRANLPP